MPRGPGRALHVKSGKYPDYAVSPPSPFQITQHPDPIPHTLADHGKLGARQREPEARAPCCQLITVTGSAAWCPPSCSLYTTHTDPDRSGAGGSSAHPSHKFLKNTDLVTRRMVSEHQSRGVVPLWIDHRGNP